MWNRQLDIQTQSSRKRSRLNIYIYLHQVDGIFHTIGLNIIMEKESINGRSQSPGYSVVKGQVGEKDPAIRDG